MINALLTADHVSHLENVSEDEINRLLGMVVDVENLFMSVHKEEDTDTKQVYFYLFKVCKSLSHVSFTGEIALLQAINQFAYLFNPVESVNIVLFSSIISCSC